MEVVPVLALVAVVVASVAAHVALALVLLPPKAHREDLVDLLAARAARRVHPDTPEER